MNFPEFSVERINTYGIHYDSRNHVMSHADAREYLRDDNCSISEVARKCGFSSPSYFSQKFRQYSTCTPSSYRNAVHNHRKMTTIPF